MSQFVAIKLPKLKHQTTNLNKSIKFSIMTVSIKHHGQVVITNALNLGGPELKSALRDLLS